MKKAFAIIFLASVSAATANAEEKGFLGAAFGEGKQIQEVIADTPAAKAGLMVGDVILAVGDVEPADTTDLLTAINTKKPGEEITLKVQRDGKELAIDVKLVRRTVRFFLEQKDPPRVKGGTISLGGGRIGTPLFTNRGNMVVQRGTATIAGSYQQLWTGLLDIKIDRREAPQALAVTGEVMLGGLLHVSFENFTPKIGDKFEIVSGAAAMHGTFDDLMLPELGMQDGKELTCILKYDDLEKKTDLDGDGRYDVTLLVVDAATVMPEVPDP